MKNFSYEGGYNWLCPYRAIKQDASGLSFHKKRMPLLLCGKIQHNTTALRPYIQRCAIARL